MDCAREVVIAGTSPACITGHGTCERWGSLIHSLWDDVAGLGPSRMVTRLLLKESGLLCQGAPQDEAFVREIARVLVDVEGRTTSKKTHT